MAKFFSDKEVYGIIEDKSIEGMPTTFTVERAVEDAFRPELTSGPLALTLPQAIAIAVKNSREYQAQKESLYAQGLALTLARHKWDPLFSSTVDATVQHKYVTATTGGKNPQTQVTTVDYLTGSVALGVKKMLITGGDFSANIVTDFSRYLGQKDPQEQAFTTVKASLSQPLLKGFGYNVALEPIRQAERDMMYAIRSFVRYRRKFSVTIAKDYYDLLQRKDQTSNTLTFYKNMQKDLDKARFLAQAGRLPGFEVDQREQSTLSAKVNWLAAQSSYESALDAFKLTLGIPTSASIEVAPLEKDALVRAGLVPLSLSLDEATSIALAERLDMRTTRDQTEDAQRKVKVAENGLLMTLGATVGYENKTLDPNRPYSFDKVNGVASYGGSAELPLDKKADRNVYRQSLITLEASKRNEIQLRDTVTLDIRDALRTLQLAAASHPIQVKSLDLAERRVDSTSLLLEAGRATTRDVLDAQQSRLDAQNAVTRALVNYIKARLDLYIAMETLKLDDNGLWQEESNHASTD